MPMEELELRLSLSRSHRGRCAKDRQLAVEAGTKILKTTPLLMMSLSWFRAAIHPSHSLSKLQLQSCLASINLAAATCNDTALVLTVSPNHRASNHAEIALAVKPRPLWRKTMDLEMQHRRYGRSWKVARMDKQSFATHNIIASPNHTHAPLLSTTARPPTYLRRPSQILTVEPHHRARGAGQLDVFVTILIVKVS